MEGMKIITTYGTSDYADEVIELWNTLGALPPNVNPQERVKQVVCVIESDNRIIGVSTTKRVLIKQLNNNYFFNYRLLIHPEYRIPGLTEKLGKNTIERLENDFITGKTDCIGMITLVENNEYKDHRKQAVWPDTGFIYIGNSAKGHHLRVRYFKGAII